MTSRAGSEPGLRLMRRGISSRFGRPTGAASCSARTGKGDFDLYRKAVDSVGAEELLYADDLNKRPTSWSADGKLLLYDAIGPNSKTGQDIWVLPLRRNGQALL